MQLAGLAIVGYYPHLVNYMPVRTYLTSETAPPPVNPGLQYCLEEQVFREYDERETAILDSLAMIRRSDFDVLPDVWRDSLTDSFGLAENTFGLVKNAREAGAELEAFIPGYKPLHNEVRQLEMQIKDMDDRLEILQDEHRQWSRDTDAEPERLQSIELAMDELELKRKSLEDRLPADWPEQNKKYKDLAQAEKSARVGYRRNSDAAYEPLQKLLRLLDQTAALSGTQAAIGNLASAIENQPAAIAIETIKSVESRLGDFDGASKVKSQLSKSRRALKGDNPDIESAKQHHAQALSLLAEELEWRERASSLLPALRDYDNSIKDTIGARLQPRFTKARAKQIAACRSVHRDVSLYF